MDDRLKKWFYDVKVAIDEIELFLSMESVNFDNYSEHIMLKRAVERNLEIIGEAIKRIISTEESYIKLITDSHNIIGLRNQVIHAYDNISDEIIWSVIETHLPKLKFEILKIMDNFKQ